MLPTEGRRRRPSCLALGALGLPLCARRDSTWPPSPRRRDSRDYPPRSRRPSGDRGDSPRACANTPETRHMSRPRPRRSSERFSSGSRRSRHRSRRPRRSRRWARSGPTSWGRLYMPDKRVAAIVARVRKTWAPPGGHTGTGPAASSPAAWSTDPDSRRPVISATAVSRPRKTGSEDHYPGAVVVSTSITAASLARSVSLAGRLLGFLASRL